jgi:hypothetical protein
MSDNLVAIVKDYFERALLEVPGMKCLIMDQETTSIFLKKPRFLL